MVLKKKVLNSYHNLKEQIWKDLQFLFNFMTKNEWIIPIIFWLSLFYLFNGIYTPHGLFTTEIWFFCKCFIVIINIFSMLHCI